MSSGELTFFSLAITSHMGKGPAVHRWLGHLFMLSGPLFMPVGQSIRGREVIQINFLWASKTI